MDFKPQQPEPIPTPMGPRGFFSGVGIRPILTGVIVDQVATMIFQFLYLLPYLPREAFEEGGGSKELVDKAVREMTTSTVGLLNLTLIGALCLALGGYIAGRMARSEKIKHGALVGLASLAAGILIRATLGEGNPGPDWYEALVYILPIPVGALGGYFAEKRW